MAVTMICIADDALGNGTYGAGLSINPATVNYGKGRLERMKRHTTIDGAPVYLEMNHDQREKKLIWGKGWYKYEADGVTKTTFWQQYEALLAMEYDGTNAKYIKDQATEEYNTFTEIAILSVNMEVETGGPVRCKQMELVFIEL